MAPAKLREAAADLRYLLSRGYRRESAVRFVGDKHTLSRTERLILYRCVYDAATAADHRVKLVRPDHVSGRTLSVDGYNVLITTENLLSGALVIMSDDGLLRDVSGISSRYTVGERTEEALGALLSAIRDAKPSRVTWLFDAPIPRSGELAALVRRRSRNSGLEGDAQTVKAADRASVRMGEVVASSDSVAVEKTARILDLPQQVAVARGLSPPRVEDLDGVAWLCPGGSGSGNRRISRVRSLSVRFPA